MKNKKQKNANKKLNSVDTDGNIYRLYHDINMIHETLDKNDVFEEAMVLHQKDELSRTVIYEISKDSYRIIWKNGVPKPKTSWTPKSFGKRRTK